MYETISYVIFHNFIGFEQNVLSEDENDTIWKPNVGYTNAKLGTIQIQKLGTMVRRESKPELFDFSSDVEGKNVGKRYNENVFPLISIIHLNWHVYESNIIDIVDKIYSGASNSLIMKTKVYAEYGCVFSLQNFPFDTQNCSMQFTMDSAKEEYIKLIPRNISFQVRNNSNAYCSQNSNTWISTAFIR